MKHTLRSALLAALLAGCVSTQADPYGLLFTTPDQRARLDNRFISHGANDEASVGDGHTEPQVALPLKLNGTLVGNAGKKEVWINGEGQLAPGENSNAHVHLLTSDRVRVKPSASAPAHDMKPGQVLDPNTGIVSEAYERAGTR